MYGAAPNLLAGHDLWWRVRGQVRGEGAPWPARGERSEHGRNEGDGKLARLTSGTLRARFRRLRARE